MDLNFFTGLADKLLPRSPAWDLTHDGPLRKFFYGLSVLPMNVRDHLAGVLLEMVPEYTTMLHDWSEQFGSTEDFDAEELRAAWGAFGGQDPDYIQATLRAIGVDVYVHQWWVPDSDPLEARNPEPLYDSSYVLVNDLNRVSKNYTYQFGDGTQFGDGSQFGSWDGYFLQRKYYPYEGHPQVYWYVGGENWPDYAMIPAAKLEKLIRLIFKIKPIHTRVILRVVTDDNYDIQDVSTPTPIEIQDTSDPTDVEIQDI